MPRAACRGAEFSSLASSAHRRPLDGIKTPCTELAVSRAVVGREPPRCTPVAESRAEGTCEQTRGTLRAREVGNCVEGRTSRATRALRAHLRAPLRPRAGPTPSAREGAHRPFVPVTGMAHAARERRAGRRLRKGRARQALRLAPVGVGVVAARQAGRSSRGGRVGPCRAVLAHPRAYAWVRLRVRAGVAGAAHAGLERRVVTQRALRASGGVLGRGQSGQAAHAGRGRSHIREATRGTRGAGSRAGVRKISRRARTTHGGVGRSKESGGTHGTHRGRVRGGDGSSGTRGALRGPRSPRK